MKCAHTWGSCLILHGGHHCILAGEHSEHRCFCGETEPAS